MPEKKMTKEFKADVTSSLKLQPSTLFSGKISRRNFGKLLGLASVVPMTGSMAGCGGGDDSADTVSPAPTSYAISKEAKVTVAGGEMQGTNLPTGVRAFLGVPYAAPPVGSLRWKAPQPVVPWTGTKATQTNPPAAITSLNPVTLSGTTTPWKTSEDCLYLNMWVPPETIASAGSLPVMVWMHGGGGNISETRYMGDELAKKGIIYILAARRQGIFSTLALSSLSAETENKGSSGNLDMLDMIAALKWVQDNIAKFGGDPNNVTLSGQSMGSQSVSKLQACPLTKGLFKRVFGQSGSTISGTKANTGVTLATAEANGAAWMAKFGTGTTVADLRAKTTAEILAVSGSLSAGFDYILPDTPQNLFLAGKQQDVPMYIGFCRDEATMPAFTGVTDLASYNSKLSTKFGADATAVFNLYPAFSNADAVTQSVRLNNEYDKGKIMVAWASAQKMTGKSPVYMFLFFRGNSSGTGAAHGRDVNYWTGKLTAAYGDNTFPYTTTADYELSSRMMDSLVSWCKTGNPNTAEVSVPEFNAADEKVAGFDERTIATVPIYKGVDWFVANSNKY
jgi:para-nitrobenzyl esterase